MSRKHRSILSIATVVALTLLTPTGCALLGLEEEEETTTEVARSLSDLEGTWASSCVSDGSSGSVGNNVTVIFSGTEFTFQIGLFIDSSCADPMYLMQTTYNNSTAGTPTTFNDGTSGYQFAATVKAVRVTIQNSLLIAVFNSGSGTCGKTDWTLNVAGDITGVANCGGGDIPSQGTAHADKYKVSGTSLTLNNLGSFTKQ